MTDYSTFPLISTDILDDLTSRFIINIPEEEQKDLIRICFQIELAHWFYLDFYCSTGKMEAKKCGMKEFTWNLFNHIPFLRNHISKLNTVLDMWRNYKQSVPTYGAIILDEDMSHVLLVQGFYAKSSWGFPKGKVNEDEHPMHCAIREVLEETGYDISAIVSETEYVEAVINEQTVRLYLVSGVPKDTKFNPCTRCEIRAVQWFPISDLPVNKKDSTPKLKIGFGPNNFFMVMPFMRKIKRWIAEKNGIHHNSNSDPEEQHNGVNGTRRARIKSQGDQENGKCKKQLFSIQQEVNDYIQFRNNTPSSVPKASVSPFQNRNSRQNGNGRAKQGQQKQQIPVVNGNEKGKNKQIGNITVQYDKNGMAIIHAPSWTNFRFDRRAIVQQLMN